MMKIQLNTFIKNNLSLLILLCSLSTAKSQFAGTWNGEININGFNLPLVFHVTCSSTLCTSVFDSPKQSVFGAAVNTTIYRNDSVYFMMSDIRALYKGIVHADKKIITGQFQQTGMTADLTLNFGPYVEIKPNRPQEPVEPLPYVVKKVLIKNKKDGVTLAGTLTLPDTLKKYPAVILVSGSGPQDRDESLLDHKPFLIIADYLTRNGFAVLRYDDRGVGESTGNFSEATSVDFSYDAESCFEFLQKNPFIKTKQIGLAGHSEGGMIVPMIASRNKDVAFIILLAGPGVNGEEIIVKQTELIGLAEGEGDAQKSAETNRKLITALKSSRDPKISAAAMRKVFHDEFSKMTATELMEFNDTALYIKQNIAQMNTHWFRYFVSYEPVPVIQKVKCAALVLNGDKDLQVDSKQNIPPIENALKQGKNKNYKVVELKNHNHLFQHSETGKISEYGTIEETFSTEALDIIKEWLQKLPGRP